MSRHMISYALILILGVRIVGEYLDGWLFPVLTPWTITHHQSEAPATTYLTATAKKTRDCKWVRTEWFVGLRGEPSVGVPVLHHEAPRVRGIGVWVWTNVEVLLPWTLVSQNSHADVFHDCYRGWLWETRTALYDALDTE